MSFPFVPALTGLILLTQGAQAASVAGTDALSPALAESLSRKLDQIELHSKSDVKRRKTGSVAVSESELNSYFRFTPDSMPRGVSDMAVDFEPHRIVARGQVDLSLLKPKVDLSPFHPLYWLSGVVPVDVAGRVESHAGMMKVEWEEVRVASVPVSSSMLRELVVTATRNSKRYPGGFDILAPFKMPYDVKKVRLEASRALVDY
jgi:hypothetical protein